MKALVYRGLGKQQLEALAKPGLRAAADAVVRMVKTTVPAARPDGHTR